MRQDNYVGAVMDNLTNKTAAAFALACLCANAHALDSESRLGNLLTLGLPVAAAGLSWLDDDTQGLVQLAKSQAATVAAVEALKSATRQTRPDGSDSRSFPSAHTAVAFSAAQYLQMKGGWELGAPAYLAASYVASSRVAAGEHRWRDVVAGAATGALTTYYFTDSSSGQRLGATLAPRSFSLLLQRPYK